MHYIWSMTLSPKLERPAGGAPATPPRASSRLWRWLGYLRKAVLVSILLVAALQVWFLVRVISLISADPSTTAFMDSERDRLAALKPPGEIRRSWVPYDSISTAVKQAIIASEDARFMTHHGVDWGAMRYALRTNEKRGRIAVGGSTITMQLAKNLYLSGDRNYLRKGQEIVIAHMMEAVLSKRRILEIYLNSVEWGIGVFGVEAAARHYFKKPASQLTSREAAWLAAILPAPRRYDSQRNAPFANRKAMIIQRRMGSAAYPK
jgi:monofunctional biosynthetic peptidoglycan transglycosylase